MNLSFARLNIAQKFIVFLLLASILPLLVVGISSYSVSKAMIQDQAAQTMELLVANETDYLDLQLRQVDSLISNLAGVETILDALGQDGSGDPYTDLATQARIGYILDGYSGLDGLVSIDLFGISGRHYHVGDTLSVSNIRTEVKDEIFKEAIEANGEVIWTGIEDNINGNSGSDKVITAGRILTRTNPTSLRSKTIGLLVVNLSVDTVYKHFQMAASALKGGSLMVIDTKNRILYHPDRTMLGATANLDFISKMQGSAGNFEDSPNNQPTIFIYRRSEKTGWIVLSMVPVVDLLAQTRPIQVTSILAIAIALALILGSTLIVSHHMMNPLRQIIERFKRFQEGEMDLKPLQFLNSTDEIGELVQWFNAFQDNLRAKRQAEEALRESEERFSLAVRGANDGVWDWDLRTNRIYYSSRWKAILGFEENQLDDSPSQWMNRIHPDDAILFQQQLNAHLSGKTPDFRIEFRICMADDRTYHWVLARGLAVRTAEGKAQRMAGSLTDISVQKTVEEQLRHDAMHDSLTGLPNRAYFIEQLQRCLDRCNREGQPHSAVLFLDLDRFKIVNDSLGHAFGDRMLVVISQRLAGGLRSIDMLARFGGDEFAILLDDIHGVQEAIQVADRLQQKLAVPLSLEGREIFTTASIGIAMISPGIGGVEDLLRNADTAMYQAKAHGRSRYALYGEEMHKYSMAVLQMEAQLRRALERQEFVVHYQPIISMKSGEVVAVEALVRWMNEEGRLVPPGEFIPLAEETGIIVPLGEWVLRTACAQASQWRKSGLDHLIMSVNISARQLHDRRLPDLVREVLEGADLPGSALQLEITESDAMLDMDLTVQILRELNEMGVKSAIDDFGNSYSSLGYLKRFPVTSIKIDKSFIHDVNSDRDVAAIITAMIAMAHILDLETVAEGVEDEQQVEFLRAQGCDRAQGYLFSVPKLGEDLMHLMDHSLLT